MLSAIAVVLMFLTTCVAGGFAALSDVKCLRLPNKLVGIIGGSFFVAWGAQSFLGGGEWVPGLWNAILAAAVIFIITVLLTALRVIGAGDSKFATVLALWMGTAGLPVFLFYMALSGGVLGVISLFLRKKPVFKNPPKGGWVASAQAGQDKLPYGVAIMIGALVSFSNLGYFNINTYLSILTGGS